MRPSTSRCPVCWLSLSLAIPLSVWLATAGFLSIPANTGKIDLAAGKQTFQARCSACHFAKDGFPAHHGPNLHDIGRTAASRRPTCTAAEYILESILQPDAFVAPTSRPGMPKKLTADLSPEAIRNVVAFLASCGAVPDYDEISRLEIPDLRADQTERVAVRREEMEMATRVFREKGSCMQCHALHNQPEHRVFAPALFGVGFKDAAYLRESIVDPTKSVAPNYRCVSVILSTGQQRFGRLVSRDAKQVALLTSDPAHGMEQCQIPLSEIEHEDGHPLILDSNLSMMPTNLHQSLSPAEIEALIKLIRQLN